MGPGLGVAVRVDVEGVMDRGRLDDSRPLALSLTDGGSPTRRRGV